MKIVIGTRRSDLARWQANHAASKIKQAYPSADISFRPIGSLGDRDRKTGFQELGGIGVFTKESEEALLRKEVDVVVHSLKDLPTTLSQGLEISAILEREDPRDALCGASLSQVKQGLRVGTGSIRRKAQLLSLCPNAEIRPIRGNVPPRLRKAKQKIGIDCTFLAVAGLKRLGLDTEIDEILSADIFPYAVGQGALALQCRSEDKALTEIVSLVDHQPSRLEIEAERALLKRLEAGCSLPVGVNCTSDGEILTLMAQVTSPDGTQVIRKNLSANKTDADQLGQMLADALIAEGAADILRKAEQEIMLSKRQQ